MSAPFPNDYQLRLVANSDSKPCHVCYKPSTSVLLAANNADFFYICPAHLKDETFCSCVHSEAYTKLLNEKRELEKKVVDASEAAEAHKPYSWNRIVTSMGWSDKKEETNKDKKEDNKEKKDEPQKAKTYEALMTELDVLKRQLSAVKESIASFQFKRFTLHSDIYKMRINSYLQARARTRRQQEIHSDLFFPSAPSSALQ